MSTAAERAFRASRHILPIKFVVGGRVQHVDADTKRHPIAVSIEEKQAVRDVIRALNEYYYSEGS
jgi:hypothetical protein